MNKHIYYQLTFKLLSPMLIGSGRSDNTDKDALVDGSGRPVIPATSVAGTLRCLCRNETDEMRLFGSLKDGQGLVTLYDAHLADDTRAVYHLRDNVTLDKWRVAAKSLKFDYETIAPGTVFTGYAELPTSADDKDVASFEALLAAYAKRQCCLGSKTARGLGRIELSVIKKSFDFDKPAAIRAWLDFDLLGSDAFKENDQWALPKAEIDEWMHIQMSLRLKSALSIRVYTTDVNDADFKTLKYDENDDQQAVVSGTSWAGAFRHRFTELMGEDNAEALFGCSEKKQSGTAAQRSRIEFSETLLTGGEDKWFTRNAIDRFSGKVKNSALYSEVTHYGGEGPLEILVRRDCAPALRKALAAIILDLHNGFMAVGGITSIGRGLFAIQSVCIDGKLLENWEGALMNAVAE